MKFCGLEEELMHVNYENINNSNYGWYVKVILPFAKVLGQNRDQRVDRGKAFGNLRRTGEGSKSKMCGPITDENKNSCSCYLDNLVQL